MCVNLVYVFGTTPNYVPLKYRYISKLINIPCTPYAPTPKLIKNAHVAHHCWYIYVFIHKTFITTLKVDVDQ